jgi:superfamily II DNA/RNA helicase
MVVGGASLFKQAQALSKGTDVLVATPGRLIDLLERGDVSLEKCGYLVLDEADHMLDMGFIHSLRKIAKHIPLKRQTLLFSATMPKDISEIADTYLRDPVKVQVAPPGKPSSGSSRASTTSRTATRPAAGGISQEAPGRTGAGLRPHQARVGKADEAAGDLGLQGRLDPRQQKPEPA